MSGFEMKCDFCQFHTHILYAGSRLNITAGHSLWKSVLSVKPSAVNLKVIQKVHSSTGMSASNSQP